MLPLDLIALGLIFVQERSLILPYSGCALVVLIDVFKLLLLSYQVVLHLGDGVVVERGLEHEPHLLDLPPQPIDLPLASPKFPGLD